MLEPCLAEVKHQGEQKLWHPEPLACGRFLYTTIHRKNRWASTPMPLTPAGALPHQTSTPQTCQDTTHHPARPQPTDPPSHQSADCHLARLPPHQANTPPHFHPTDLPGHHPQACQATAHCPARPQPTDPPSHQTADCHLTRPPHHQVASPQAARPPPHQASAPWAARTPPTGPPGRCLPTSTLDTAHQRRTPIPPDASSKPA
jgi:hypothetical protein